jgi:hypothetical protein
MGASNDEGQSTPTIRRSPHSESRTQTHARTSEIELSEGSLHSNRRHKLVQHFFADALVSQVQRSEVGVSVQLQRKLPQLIRRHPTTAVSLAQVDDSGAARAVQNFLQVRLIVSCGGRAVARTRLCMLWLHAGRDI